MTVFPAYKLLSDYSHIYDTFPFHISLNEVRHYFPAHRHDFLEFSLVIEGRGTETVNGKVHEMKPGTFTFLLPYQVHEIRAYPGSPLKLFNCMFDMELLFRAPGESASIEELLLSETSAPAFVHLSGDGYEEMRTIVGKMMREFAEADSWRQTLLKLKLMEAIILFDRLRRPESAPPSDEPADKQAENRAVWTVIRHIHMHYREDLQLGTVAQTFGISPSRLSEQLKKHIGHGFVRFLHEVRIRHACSLLASTDMRSIDVAFEVGFGSFQSFSRIFRELKGISPKQFRIDSVRVPEGKEPHV